MGESGLITNDAHRFAPAAPDEDVVYGACSPGWHTAAEQTTALDHWISFMQRADISRVCCLVPGQRLDDHSANVGRYREAFGDSRVCHAPIPQDRLVSDDRLQAQILPFLRAATTHDEPVVVHSLSGLGRTGYVLAAWLVADRNYRPSTAIETVTEMGRNPLEPVERGNATRRELLDLLASVQ